MEVEDAVEAGGGEPPLNEHDKAFDDLFIGEIPLPEYGQNVLNPRSRGLAEDVLPPQASQVGLDRGRRIPMEQQCLVSGNSAPALMILDE